MWRRGKLAFALALTQVTIIILFVLRSNYGPDADASFSAHSQAPALGGQDPKDNSINKYQSALEQGMALILVSLGLSMSHFTDATFAGVGFNFLLTTISLQLSLVLQNIGESLKIDAERLLNSEWVALATSVMLGTVTGIASPLQLLILTVIGVVGSMANGHVVIDVLGATDFGGTLRTFIWGATFGNMAALVFWNRNLSAQGSFGKRLATNSTSQFVSFLGTILLLVTWPNFVTSNVVGDKRHRMLINLYLGIASATVTSFIAASLIDSQDRFNVRVANVGITSGAVFITGVSIFMLQPSGALLVGCSGASIGILCNLFLCVSARKRKERQTICCCPEQPLVSKLTMVQDHFAIGAKFTVTGTFTSLIVAFLCWGANEIQYGWTLYEMFPLRAPKEDTNELEEIEVYFNRVKAGEARSAKEQAISQLIAIAVTLLSSIVLGLLTGFLISFDIFDAKKHDQIFEDNNDWILPTREHLHLGSDSHCDSWKHGLEIKRGVRIVGNRYRSFPPRGNNS